MAVRVGPAIFASQAKSGCFAIGCILATERLLLSMLPAGEGQDSEGPIWCQGLTCTSNACEGLDRGPCASGPCQMETTLNPDREARQMGGFLCGSRAPIARGAGWTVTTCPCRQMEPVVDFEFPRRFKRLTRSGREACRDLWICAQRPRSFIAWRVYSATPLP